MFAIFVSLFLSLCFSIAAFRVYTENTVYLYGSAIEYGDFGSIAMTVFFSLLAVLSYGLVLYATYSFIKNR